MSEFNKAYVNEQTLLEVYLDDGATNKYPRAYLYTINGVPITTLNMFPAADGWYQQQYLPLSVGYFFVVYKVYTTNLYNIIDATYTFSSDTYQVLDRTQDRQDLVNAVWDENLNSHVVANSAGKVLHDLPAAVAQTALQGTLQSHITDFNTKITTARAYLLDNLANLDAQVSTRLDWATFNNRITVARAALLDNLSRLDVAVSSRADQTTLTTLNTDFHNRITAQRAQNLDNLDAPVSAQTANVAAIKAKTDQLGFTGAGLVKASAQELTDKTNISLSPAAVNQIISSTWNELLSAHTTPGTTGYALGAGGSNPSAIADAVWNAARSSHQASGSFGEGAQGVITVDRGNRLDYLDVPVSSVGGGGGGGGPIYIPGLTPQRIANLDYLDIGVSSRATEADMLAVKAKTNNLPPDPASATAVSNIPTNPLLSNDARLVNLDAKISTRATPADVANLATAAALANDTSYLAGLIAQVQVLLATKASTTDVTTAVAPLAKTAQIDSVIQDIDELVIPTPNDIWTNSIRTLTAPVDTTVDLSLVAKTAELLAVRDQLVASLTVWGPKLTVGINPYTDEMELMAWLEKSGLIVYAASQATVKIYDKDNNLVLDIGPDMMISDEGVFSFTRANASQVVTKNRTYTCEVIIVHESQTYQGFVPISVF